MFAALYQIPNRPTACLQCDVYGLVNFRVVPSRQAGEMEGGELYQEL